MGHIPKRKSTKREPTQAN